MTDPLEGRPAIEPRSTAPPAVYEVAPVRLGGGARRPSWRLRIGVLAVVVGVGVAAIGPRDGDRPFFDLSGLVPAPQPSAGGSQPPGQPADASPRADGVPIPTDFPPVAFGDGRPPDEPLHVVRHGLVMVDPTSGGTVAAGFEGAYRAIFTDPEGRFVCLCVEAPWSGASAGFTVRVERHDPLTGASQRGVAMLELEGGPSVQAFVQPLQFDVDLAPDGRHLYLATVVLEGAWWIVRLHALDVETGTVRSGTILGAIEGLPDLQAPVPIGKPPTAGPATWAEGPLFLTVPVVQVAPDGRSLRVMAEGHDASISGDAPTWQHFNWQVALGGDGRPGSVTRLPDERRSGEDYCFSQGYGGEDRYLRICHTLDGPRASVFVERANGERARAIPLTTGEGQALDAALVDTVRGWLYLWSPSGHHLSRIDLETGERQTLELDPDVLLPPAADLGRPAAPRPVAWSRPARALDPFQPSLVGSPDGRYLYAAGGTIADPFGLPELGPLDLVSTGVWVIDAERLELLDRWLLETAVSSIGLTPDGEFLLAIGVPGVDRGGDRTYWGSSLTAIDTRSGVLAARYASIGDGIRVIDPMR